MVQFDEQGREQAWAMSLPEGFPTSAVAAEHLAMLLCHSGTGRLFKKAPGGTAVAPTGKSRAGRSPIKKVAHGSHCLHTATFGDAKNAGRVSEILFCSRRGTYGTHKIARLKNKRKPR